MSEEMAMQYQRGYIDGFKEGKTTFELKTDILFDKIKADFDEYDDTDLIKAKYVRQIIDKYKAEGSE